MKAIFWSAVTSVLLVLIPRGAMSSNGITGFSTRQISQSAIVLVLCYDSIGNQEVYGTGLVLYNYQDTSKFYLLTATHILKPTRSVDIAIVQNGRAMRMSASQILVQDSIEGRKFYVHIDSMGNESDLSVIPISRHLMLREFKRVMALSRSLCSFQDSVCIGDKLLAVGYADPKVFPFVVTGGPIAVSGIVAFEASSQYLMDQAVEHGMSGGIVFKETPVFGEYIYRAVGIVSSKMPRDTGYSWITKIDFVDSALVQVTGKAWGK